MAPVTRSKTFSRLELILLVGMLGIQTNPTHAQNIPENPSVQEMIDRLAPAVHPEDAPARTRNLKPIAIPQRLRPSEVPSSNSGGVSPAASETAKPSTTPPWPASASSNATPGSASSIQAGPPADSGKPAMNRVQTMPPPQLHAATEVATTAPSLDLNILFELGSSRISKPSLPILERLVLALRDSRLADSQFRIEGHTDTSGNANANTLLSEKRAQSVLNFLAQKGIDRQRMDAVGKGSTELLIPDMPQSAKNRRVRITVLN